MLEPEIILAIDNACHAKPMPCGIMVVKSIQGRSCSRLLKVLNYYGGLKSMIKEVF